MRAEKFSRIQRHLDLLLLRGDEVVAKLGIRLPASIWREPSSQIGTLKAADGEPVGTVLLKGSFRAGSSRFDLNLSRLVIDDEGGDGSDDRGDSASRSHLSAFASSSSSAIVEPSPSAYLPLTPPQSPVSFVDNQRLPIAARIEVMEDLANAQPLIVDDDCPAESTTMQSPSYSLDENTPASGMSCESGSGILSISPVSSQEIVSRSRSPLESKTAGLVSLEVVAAQNLPKEAKWFRANYQSNPFVVVSLGRQTFRTRVVRRNQNPVWRERIHLTVQEHELANYAIALAVYGYDRLGPNNCLGKATLPLACLLPPGEQPRRLALPLGGGGEAQLLVRALFTPYPVLRQNFWRLIARQYDGDGNGRLNRIELTAMLESLGSQLSDQALGSLLGPDDDAEHPLEEVVAVLEQATESLQLTLDQCPVCGQPVAQDDPVGHVALCAAKDASGFDHVLMTGGFLTEEYASRKWWMRLVSFVSFGGYQPGRNNGHILVHDRQSGRLLEERISFYVRLGIRLIYQSVGANRATDWRMVKQLLAAQTRRHGARCDAPSSVAWIPAFIAYHQLDMSQVEVPPSGSFASFNEFFYRRLKPGSRPICAGDERTLVSPADCRLHVFPSVSQACQLWIKGRGFTVGKLLGDEQLGHFFADGPVAVCRLAPQDYHRFHAPVDGRLVRQYFIEGQYYTVNPMAIRTELDVFGENARTVYLFDCPHGRWGGRVAMVAVGAMMVGSIRTTASEGQYLKRGDEVGYFAFGGSTLILLFSPGSLATWDPDLLANSQQCLETLVQMGMSIGTSHN